MVRRAPERSVPRGVEGRGALRQGGHWGVVERTPDTAGSEDPVARETTHLEEGIVMNTSDRYGHVHD